MINKHCKDSYEVSAILTKILIVLGVVMVVLLFVAVMGA